MKSTRNLRFDDKSKGNFRLSPELDLVFQRIYAATKENNPFIVANNDPLYKRMRLLSTDIDAEETCIAPIVTPFNLENLFRFIVSISDGTRKAEEVKQSAEQHFRRRIPRSVWRAAWGRINNKRGPGRPKSDSFP